MLSEIRSVYAIISFNGAEETCAIKRELDDINDLVSLTGMTRFSDCADLSSFSESLLFSEESSADEPEPEFF